MMITFFSLNINIILLAISLGVLLGSLLLSKLFKRVISPFLLRRFAKTRFHYDEIIVRAFTRPTTVMIGFLGLFFFIILLLESIGVTLGSGQTAISARIMRVAIIIYLTAGILGSSDIFAEILRTVGSKVDIETGKLVSRFIGYIFKFLVIALSTVIVISEFGYDVNGLLAGLGLGGLTFALAAQESATNFFGGLVIIMEKPFDVGDWVVLENVEGSVEAVTVRSTHIKDINGTMIVIPNSKIIANPIVSYKNIEMRYASHMINFQPDNELSSLTEMVQEMERLLLDDVEVIADTVIVKLADITLRGITVKLAYGTKTTDYMKYLDKKQSVNIELIRLINKYQLRLNVINNNVF